MIEIRPSLLSIVTCVVVVMVVGYSICIYNSYKPARDYGRLSYVPVGVTFFLFFTPFYISEGGKRNTLGYKYRENVSTLWVVFFFRPDTWRWKMEEKKKIPIDLKDRTGTCVGLGTLCVTYRYYIRIFLLRLAFVLKQFTVRLDLTSI